jgi:transposase-like protein
MEKAKRVCPRCHSEKTRKNGVTQGIQRCLCAACGRTFSETPRFSQEIKQRALAMYLNNVGIRKIALFLGVNPSTVLGWIRRKHAALSALLEKSVPSPSEKTGIIEMDEIDTFVQKNRTGPLFGLLTVGEKSALLRL